MSSRLGRYEDRKQRRRILFALLGIVGILALLFVFGLKLLVGFSVLVDRMRGSSPAAQSTHSLILPPVLDPLPIATNSAKLTVTGSGRPGLTAIVYQNEVEKKKISVDRDGVFTVELIGSEGDNIISAKFIDGEGNTSELSTVLSVMVKTKPPILEVSAPADSASFSSDTQSIRIEGKTEPDNTVSVNDRFAIVDSSGSFSYILSRFQGEQTIKITATDPAGNTKTVERRVRWE